MLAKYNAVNTVNDEGNPTGGFVSGTGLNITWQNGPLKEGGKAHTPNGAFVETVIDACRQRLAFFQEASKGKFACEENAEAIQCLNKALAVLSDRTKSREKRGVEGTHQV